jgi:parallel beta-helix repeat protein
MESLENRLAMATLYVAPTGNDSSSGASTAPWLTLQKAADVAQPGDTVVVRAGNYKGFYMDRSGTAAAPITFKADAGAAITSRNATTADGINLEGANYINIEGFTINNMPRAGIRSVTNHHINIRNNKLDSNGYWGIFTGFASDVTIEGNTASRSQIEHGIYFSNSGDRAIIRNNIVWGNNRNGIHMNGDIEAGGGDGIVSDSLVEGNIIYENGRNGGSAINCDGVQNSVFRNNILYNNHASGISLYRINAAQGASGNKITNNTIVMASDARWALNIQNASTNNTVYNNILYNNSARGSINISPDSRSGFKSDYNAVMSRFTLDDSSQISLDQWRSTTGQDRNSLIATPAQLFANVAANDYHLSATSPALDKGTITNAPSSDFEGTARPQGAGMDIGADELGGTSPTPTPTPDPDPTPTPTPTPTTPTTWYVSATGNDANAGSATAPWKTLQKAADSVQAGDTVIVKAGNYVGFDLRTDGTADKRITFRGESGAAITTRNAATPDGINLEGADYVTIEGFAVNGMERAGIRSVENNNVVLRNNTANANTGWGILTAFSDDLLIEGNTITGSKTQSGIHLSNSGDRPVVRGNTISGNYLNGIFLDGDATSGGDGIITGAVVEANKIFENGTGGGSAIDGDGVQNSLIQNNLVYNNHRGGITLYKQYGGGASTGNKVVNNSVVNAADGNWALNLQSGSTNNTILNNVLLSRSSTMGSVNVSPDSRTGLVSNYNAVMSRLRTDGTNNITLAQWQSATGQDKNSLVATPEQLFVNAAGNDYHLSDTSLAWDKGTATNAPTKDFEGTVRPQGAAVDIGADERTGTAPTTPTPTPDPTPTGTKYVSTTGNDANDGSATSPWRTLQKAANSVQPGDTVIVKAGNYAGFDLRRDGTADKRITFRGEAGAAITSRNAKTPDGINLEGADYVTVEGFTINSMPRAGIRSVLNSNVVLRNNTANLNTNWGILTAFSNDLLIEGNTITGTKTYHGIHLSNSGDRPVVRGNTISGSRLSGIYLDGDITSGGDGIITGAVIEANKIFDNGAGGGSAIDGDGVQNSLFQNNLLYNNHRGGITLYKTSGGGASTGNKLVNNTVVNAADGNWALNLQSGSINTMVLNNVLYSRSSTMGSVNISPNSRTGFVSNYNAVMGRMRIDGATNISLAQWQSSTGQDKNSLVATPEQLFVNAAGNDYRLSDTSPAWDKGTATNAPTKDFEGTTRPQGAAMDIGADERIGTAPTTSPTPTPTPTGTKYVSTTGSDSNDGSATRPWLTLQKAANAAQPGDTVIVKAGNYKGFYMDRDGTAAAPITFRAEKGAAITSSNGTTGDGINLEGADYVTIEGFTINNMPRAGIRSVTNHNVTILNNSVDSNGVWGIFTAYSDDVRIEGNSASRSVKEHGIYVSNSGDRPIIRNNVTWGNNVCGIHMNGDVEAGNGDGIITGALVEGNVVYDNGRGGGSAINADGVQNSVFQNNLLYNNHASGISLFKWNGAAGSSGNKVLNNTILNASDSRWALNIQNGSTNNTAYNNVIYNNNTSRGGINISADSRSGFKSDYNAVIGRFTLDDSNVINLDQWRSATGQDAHSFVATPSQLFVNAAGNDYHLSSTSPALDKGTTTNAPAKDFEGTARPQGSGIDIGADERVATSSVITNVAPTLTGSSTVGYTLNSTAIAVANSVKLRDPDTVSYTGGTLSVRIASGIDAGNRLSLGGSFRISDGTVKLWDGKVIGTISGDMNSSMTITLGSNATRYWTEQLVKSIRFRTVDSTSLAPRMLELQVNDGNGGVSNKLTNTINVQS